MKPADLVVCGGGAAGMSAAIAAARSGASVLLIEARPQLGGTVSHSLIHTLGGLYDSAGELLNDGLAAELAGTLHRVDSTVARRRIGKTWVLNVSPETYAATTRNLLQAESNITVWSSARVINVSCDGDSIAELTIAGPHGPKRVRVEALIDATGTAEVVRLAQQELVEDSSICAAAGLITRLRNVAAQALEFPRSLGIVKSLREAAACGRLPAACGKAWIDRGLVAHEAYLKLFVPLPADWRERELRGEITANAMSMQRAVIGLLKELPEFLHATVDRVGSLGIRDGGRVRSEYCLSVTDVRSLRTFHDAACRCSWPIEFWDSANGLHLEYLPDLGYYEIPLRSLKVDGMRNVWTAGKCVGADSLAQASARVVGTCWSMGEAVGKAAICHAGTTS